MNVLVETIKWNNADAGWWGKTLDDTEMSVYIKDDTLSIKIDDMEYKIPLEIIYGILYKENLIGR